MYAGIMFIPASLLALKRRSPLMIWYLPSAFLRTVIGWMRPSVLIDSASSSSASWSKDIRGWNGFGSMRSAGIRSTSAEPPCCGCSSLTTSLFMYPTGFLMCPRSAASSPKRALRPLPSPLCCLLMLLLCYCYFFSVLDEDLLGEAHVVCRTVADHVVQDDRLSV